MDIWHIENNPWSSIRLWRNDNDNFQVTETGRFASLLTNPNYILIDKKYSSLISGLPEQLSFHKVKVADLVLKTENDNYIELNIKNTITPQNIQAKNSKGLKIWSFDGEVFVSGEFKNELLKIGQDDFTFSSGFQFFG